MKRLLYFLIGFISTFIIFRFSYAACDYDPSDSADWNTTAIYLGSTTYSNFQNDIAIMTGGSGYSYVNFGDILYSRDNTAYIFVITLVNNVTSQQYYVWITDRATSGSNICIPLPDTDNDGIPDGLDAYPDTDSAYQFRIMTNYFDSEGNCVAQLIVTSSGDYVLLGDLTAAEIEAGVSAGTYTSDFVNSPIWIDSSDLEEDNASDIYASGNSTTPVNSTTASGLTSSATTAGANDLSTADGVTTGSTYDSGSDTDSSALGKIVDNTAAATSNQQTLANYAKKQSELQATGNALLGQINDTLKNQSDPDSFDFDEQGAETAKSEFNNLSVSNYYSADDYNGTLTPETDYDEAQDLEDVSWFTDFFSNNPLKTAFNSSGFELSSGACEVSYTIDGWGTYDISLCEFSSAFETAGNLLFSLTSLLSLIIIAWR